MMKKIILGVVIGIFLLAGGCMAMVGGAANSASDAIKEMENEKVSKDEVYKGLADKIEWKVQKDQFSTKIVGILENTLDEEIDYIQFNYKTFDKNGVVIDSSFTNETKVAPGEKRKVEILLVNKDFEKYEIKVSSSAL